MWKRIACLRRKTTLHVELADVEAPLVPIAHRPPSFFFPECHCLTSGVIIFGVFVKQGAQCACLTLRCWNKASPPPPPPPHACDSGRVSGVSGDHLSALRRRAPGFTVADPPRPYAPYVPTGILWAGDEKIPLFFCLPPSHP